MKFNVKFNTSKVSIAKLNKLNIIITTIFIFIATLIVFSCTESFINTQTAINHYIGCQDAANNMLEGSNSLMKQSYLYAITRNPVYLEAYFDELNNKHHRENAIDEISHLNLDNNLLNELKSALIKSNELVNTEVYAMKLVALATDCNIDSYNIVNDANLSNTDLSLSNEQKIAKARELLCSNDYQLAKNDIDNTIQLGMSEILESLKSQQNRNTQIFIDAFVKLIVLICMLLITLLLNSFINNKYLIKPLKHWNTSIESNTTLKVEGSIELQNLAQTYNMVFAENQATKKNLQHDASHDAMTTLLNRRTFDNTLAEYENSDRNYALFLIDIDNFKNINDTYGHNIGDQIIKKVALSIKHSFRMVDYCFRIGGDEFAVIANDMDSTYESQIKSKIENINQELVKTSNGLPLVSISIGIAFSDMKNGNSIFNNADKALYQVKENGRNGYAIYKQ